MEDDHQFQLDDMKGNMMLQNLLDIPTPQLESTRKSQWRNCRNLIKTATCFMMMPTLCCTSIQTI
jgi:hypothetical protein